MAINILEDSDDNVKMVNKNNKKDNKITEDDNPDFIIGETLLPVDGDGNNVFNMDEFENADEFLFTSMSDNIFGVIDNTNEIESSESNTVYKQRKTTDMVNMRTSPTISDNNILTVLPKGIIVNVIDVSNNGIDKWGFVNVKLLDKVLVGWVNMNYLD